ncbi:hypothetical protein [Persephonella sp.]
MVLLAGLFLSGCENFYAKYYDEGIKEKTIPCVSIHEDDQILRARIVRVFTEEKIPVRDSCPYTVEVTSKFLSQCNNPQAKSIGADFDGFLRFDLKSGGKLLYRCQMDWKGEFTDKRIRDMVRRMKKDLKFSENKKGAK